ncbi:hypothetical protein AVEN_188589-1 [Araneus ventricosus]|uniref:Uncharacterized protein n=1 Tax=Araneus ventricosus TaxID=182803 RepID=A0A4Y2HR58_ARAVE|nr:hypothetical protein AVEN_188589-1 [Araneus ventricosus]
MVLSKSVAWRRGARECSVVVEKNIFFLFTILDRCLVPSYSNAWSSSLIFWEIQGVIDPLSVVRETLGELSLRLKSRLWFVTNVDSVWRLREEIFFGGLLCRFEVEESGGGCKKKFLVNGDRPFHGQHRENIPRG